MAKYKIVSLILIFTALYACSQGSNQGNENTAAMNAPTMSYAIPSIPTKMTQKPTTTSSPPIQTRTGSPSETVIIETVTPTNTNSTISYTCLDILPSLPPEAVVDGVIITHDYASGGKSDTYLKNFSNNTNAVLPVVEGNVLVDSAVSTNRQWLASQSYNSLPGRSRLIIANAAGQVLRDLPWQKDWYTIPGWLDNDHLLITTLPTENEFGSLFIVDRVSNDQRVLNYTFPEMMYPGATYLNWGHFSYSGTIYNSSLTDVVYPRTVMDYRVIDLWDILNNREITAITTVLALSPEPKWAPDGKKIAIVQYSNREKSELLIVDLGGQIDHVTQFNNFSVDEIGSFDWSPDARYIAFWLYTEPAQYPGDRLLVIDVTTRKITNYCIPGSINGDSQPPIWSPDSSQLIVENYLGGNDRRVILLDIVHNYAAQIAVDVSPVGWMIAP